MSDAELRTAIAEAFEKDSSLNDRMAQTTHVRDVVNLLKEQGIETTQAQLLKAEARKLLDLDDAELEATEIRFEYTTSTYGGCVTWVLGCCPE